MAASLKMIDRQFEAGMIIQAMEDVCGTKIDLTKSVDDLALTSLMRGEMCGRIMSILEGFGVKMQDLYEYFYEEDIIADLVATIAENVDSALCNREGSSFA